MSVEEEEEEEGAEENVITKHQNEEDLVERNWTKHENGCTDLSKQRWFDIIVFLNFKFFVLSPCINKI